MTPRWLRYSRAGELLDAMVVRIRDIDVPAPVRGHALGVPELPIARAVAAPHGEDVAVRVELLDAVVVPVRDVDVPAPVGRHAIGEVELAVGRAGAPPRGEEGAGRIELLDAVVVPVRDVDVPAAVARHADGVVEIAVPRARLDAPLEQERAARWRAPGAARPPSGARGRRWRVGGRRARVRVAGARPHVDTAVVLARTPGLRLAHRGAAPDRMAAPDHRGGDRGGRRAGRAPVARRRMHAK